MVIGQTENHSNVPAVLSITNGRDWPDATPVGEKHKKLMPAIHIK
jgi:hypothetical protein